MQIVTYNLYKGGKSDYSAWKQIFDAYQPDIFLVQESAEPQRYLAQLSAEQQAVYGNRIAWKPAGTNYWGSAVCVHGGVIHQIEDLDNLGGWVVGVTLTGTSWQNSDRPLQIISLQAPTIKGRTYIDEVTRILDVIAAVRHPKADLVVGGDFNITVGQRQPGEVMQNRPGELEVLERLEREFGLINCWQCMHPGEPLARTLRWMFDQNSKPYHCDGIFVPTSWRDRLRSCEVIASWGGGSDHHPVVATFD